MPTIKPILFFLALLFLVVPASAYASNPSFESNFTSWDTYVFKENSYVSASVSVITDGWATHGIRSAKLYVYGNWHGADSEFDDYGYVTVTQNTNLDGDVLKVDYSYSESVGTGSGAYGCIKIDGATKYNFPSGSGTASIDISGYSGTHTVQFYVWADGDWDWETRGKGTLYIDNIRIDDILEEPVNNNLVEFAYDEEQPDTWIDVSYNIDEMQESTSEFDGYVTLDHDYSYYLEFDYETDPVQVTMPFTLNSASGTKQFLTPTFPSYPDTVEVSLIELYTVTQTWSGLSTVIEETETTLATDTLTVTTSANNTNNETLPEEPEEPEEPEDPILDPPEMPDNPFQNGTEENNETGSYNSTFLSGYYGSVDSVANYLFQPTENGFTFLMYPVNAINDSVNSANTYLLSSNAEMQGYNPIVASIFAPVVNSMPPKVQALITYNLVWLMVLMIFKRK